MKPGIYKGLSFDEYLAIKAVNKSSLDYMAQSPAHFFANVLDRNRPPKKTTDAMELGTAIHSAILEPKLFKRSYVIVPEDAPKYPTSAQWAAEKPSPAALIAMEYWTAFKKKTEGKCVIERDEHRQCLRLAKRVRKHPAAEVLLEKGDAEVVIVWVDEETGVKCKARFDWLTDGAILDFKSTRDASRDAFAKQVANMEWDVQSAMYSDGWKALTGEVPAFIFGAVEKDGPSDAFYSASEEMLKVGRFHYRARLKAYAEAKKNKKWVGYSEEITELRPPTWRLREIESGEDALNEMSF